MNLISAFLLFSTTTFVFLILFPLTGFSIKCWVCHSENDPKCADPFDNSSLPIRDCKEVHFSHLYEEEGDYDKLIREYSMRHPYDNNNKPPPKQKLKEATMCRKTRQKIHGNWRTIRSCAFLGSPGEGTGNEHHCLYRQGTHDIYLEYCTCNSKDGCNSASIPNVKLFITITLLIISCKISFQF